MQHRLQCEHRRSIRRALVVSADTAVHWVLAVASRPLEPDSSLAPACAGCSLPVAERSWRACSPSQALAHHQLAACYTLPGRAWMVVGGWHRATRSRSQWWSCWAWLACAHGVRSSAGAHCGAAARTRTYHHMLQITLVGAPRCRWQHSLACLCRSCACFGVSVCVQVEGRIRV